MKEESELFRTKTKALILALMTALALTFATGFAQFGSGNSGDAPGQQKAEANCAETIDRQEARGLVGGHQQAEVEPANCDHFFNSKE